METKRVVVGTAEGPHRCMLNHPALPQSAYDQGQSMSVEGWQHHLHFWAYTSEAPGTIRIAVGTADGPSRAILNHPSQPQKFWNEGNSMGIMGWNHHFDFWAFQSPQPGTIRICVGQAEGDGGHRCFINHTKFDQTTWNEGEVTMSVEGWQQYLEFWAFPSKPT
mmetsp:Transcript_46017/g.92319  ORF Transcript_46017/g.92319 Transcript_46017/m.92319 type:complete len:164 (-) Transcript_46017:147-638(-)